MSGMQPELMGPAGQGGELDAGSRRFRGDCPPHGYPLFSLLRVVYLAWPVVWVKPEGKFNTAGCLLKGSFYNTNIAFENQPVLKLSDQAAVGLR